MGLNIVNKNQSHLIGVNRFDVPEDPRTHDGELWNVEVVWRVDKVWCVVVDVGHTDNHRNRETFGTTKWCWNFCFDGSRQNNLKWWRKMSLKHKSRSTLEINFVPTKFETTTHSLSRLADTCRYDHICMKIGYLWSGIGGLQFRGKVIYYQFIIFYLHL